MPFRRLMRTGVWRWGLTLWLGWCAAGCGGAERPADRPSEGARRAPDQLQQVAVQCLDLLEEYRAVDLEHASEAEIQRQMDEALLNEALCADALRQRYQGPGGPVMGDHLARELGIHALKAELILSERFDDMAGYCAILADLIRALEAELGQVSEALEEAHAGSRPLSVSDARALGSLHELTLQSLQVLLVDYQLSCP